MVDTGGGGGGGGGASDAGGSIDATGGGGLLIGAGGGGTEPATIGVPTIAARARLVARDRRTIAMMSTITATTKPRVPTTMPLTISAMMRPAGTLPMRAVVPGGPETSTV